MAPAAAGPLLPSGAAELAVTDNALVNAPERMSVLVPHQRSALDGPRWRDDAFVARFGDAFHTVLAAQSIPQAHWVARSEGCPTVKHCVCGG